MQGVEVFNCPVAAQSRRLAQSWNKNPPSTPVVYMATQTIIKVRNAAMGLVAGSF